MNAPDVDLIRYGFAQAGSVDKADLRRLRIRNHALANQVMALREELEALRMVPAVGAHDGVGLPGWTADLHGELWWRWVGDVSPVHVWLDDDHRWRWRLTDKSAWGFAESPRDGMRAADDALAARGG